MRPLIFQYLVLFVFAISCFAMMEAIAAQQSIYGDIPEKVNISKKMVKSILRKNGFSRIKIIEIDYDFFENKKVYEVDFKYKGKIYEAAISLEHKFLYSKIDIDD